MKRIAGGIAALALFAAGCGSAPTTAEPGAAPSSAAPMSPAPPAEFTMTGEMDLHGYSHFTHLPGGCSGKGGYDDIAEGAQVVVYAADGKIIGTTRMGTGTILTGDYICHFEWEVPNIIPGAGPYQYEISHRGKLTITEDEARAGLSASIGK